MKCRWAICAILGAFAVVVLLPVWLTRHSRGRTDTRAGGITRANFDRTVEGLSAEGVNEVLGVPPGDYRIPPGFLLVGHGHIPWTEKARGGHLRIWYIHGSHVEVLFDRESRVVGKYWCDYGANQ